MKQIFSIFVAIAALMMVSCGGGSTPGESAVNVYQHIINGEYQEAIDMFYFDNENPEEVAQGKAMLVSLLEEKTAPQIEAKGGIQNLEVLSETIAESGNEAVVELKIVYGDGSEDTEEISMFLDPADDNWKPVLDK